MDQKELEETLANVMRKELGDLYVDRQQHFLDHEQVRKLHCVQHSEEYAEDHRFIKNMRENLSDTKTIVWKSALGLIVVGSLVYIGQSALHAFIDIVMRK